MLVNALDVLHKTNNVIEHNKKIDIVKKIVVNCSMPKAKQTKEGLKCTKINISI